MVEKSENCCPVHYEFVDKKKTSSPLDHVEKIYKDIHNNIFSREGTGSLEEAKD